MDRLWIQASLVLVNGTITASAANATGGTALVCGLHLRES
jgi:hypothetical protein